MTYSYEGDVLDVVGVRHGRDKVLSDVGPCHMMLCWVGEGQQYTTDVKETLLYRLLPLLHYCLLREIHSHVQSCGTCINLNSSFQIIG